MYIYVQVIWVETGTRFKAIVEALHDDEGNLCQSSTNHFSVVLLLTASLYIHVYIHVHICTHETCMSISIHCIYICICHRGGSS
jgi:hypothetical protein